MNVTYKDLKEGYVLKVNDDIVIHGAKYRACVVGDKYYLNYDWVSNNSLEKDRIPTIGRNEFIFHLLHISDKNSFVKDIAGKDFSDSGGSFPEVKTTKALTKVAIALLEKPLYNIGDYVTIRREIEGHNYSIYYWGFMKELVGKTFPVTKIKENVYSIKDGEIYLYELADNYLWDIAMIMPATEEEKKFVGASDKKESEKEEEMIHFITLEALKDGYIFKTSDHIRINGMDCVIHTSTDDKRFWLSSDIDPEDKIYESLGIPDDKKKELASSCGATDLGYNSPEFSNLENLSNFVKKILMYKKEDETSPKKKWSGNPTYFKLIDGRILERDDILNIHGIKYRVATGTSEGKRCWLTSSVGNSFIFKKLGIEDKAAFVRGICPIVNYGDFPEVGSYEDLTKVAIALYEVSEFKVGDKVKVDYREDDEDDYPWSFTNEMTSLQGRVYTIKEVVTVTSPTYGDKADERLSADPHCYHLDAEGREFDWHSSMLEKVSESDKKSEEPSKEGSFVKSSQISLSDLQSGYILKYTDTVVLCGETYRVYGPDCCFLNNISGGPNHSVFDKLSIKDKEYFCSLFGRVSGGDFPEFERLDSLTACVKQLMLLEQKSFGSGDASASPTTEAVKCEKINFTMDISKSDKPSDTGNVRLPEIKDDFKIIL